MREETINRTFGCCRCTLTYASESGETQTVDDVLVGADGHDIRKVLTEAPVVPGYKPVAAGSIKPMKVRFKMKRKDFIRYADYEEE